MEDIFYVSCGTYVIYSKQQIFSLNKEIVIKIS
jgi:hypothetical protein